MTEWPETPKSSQLISEEPAAAADNLAEATPDNLAEAAAVNREEEMEPSSSSASTAPANSACSDVEEADDKAIANDEAARLPLATEPDA